MAFVALLTMAGVIASISWGARLAATARDGWFERGRQASVELSSAVDTALLQIDAQIRALAVLFHSSAQVDADELAEAESRLSGDGLNVALSGLAFAVRRDGRDVSELAVGTLVRSATAADADAIAPGAALHFPIALAGRRDSPFRRGMDLMGHEALQAMAMSAVSMPGAAVMSPAFAMDGVWYAGFAVAVPNGPEDGLLFGVLRLDDLFARTVRWKPDGIELRLMQRPSAWAARSSPVLVHGVATPPTDAVATFDHRFTHGEARWHLQWSLLPTYLGGPDLVPARLVGGGGAVLSLMVGLALCLLIHQNALIRRRVDDRTAELSKALEMAEQGSRAKTNFLSVIGHELRTPLNAVIGFSDLLEAMQTSPEARSYLGFVQAGGRHLLRLVSDLLEIAQAESGELALNESTVALSDLIGEAVRAAAPLAVHSGVALEIRLDDDLPPVRGDPDRLRLILDNLLLNAVRAASANGRVTVGAVGCGDGTGLQVSVSDSGPGMTESQVTASLRLFEQVEDPMNRRNEGLGIGLPLCRHLIRLHGGALSIDTGPGRGTIVMVTLPRHRVLPRPAALEPLRMQVP